MINLLAETRKAIAESGHQVENITFIGSLESGHSCTWDEFERLADREYDNGFGAQEVASDLVIAFLDATYMTRHEYDGSECWQFNPPLVLPVDPKPIKSIFAEDGGSVGWSSLADINP